MYKEDEHRSLHQSLPTNRYVYDGGPSRCRDHVHGPTEADMQTACVEVCLQLVGTRPLKGVGYK